MLACYFSLLLFLTLKMFFILKDDLSKIVLQKFLIKVKLPFCMCMNLSQCNFQRVMGLEKLRMKVLEKCLNLTMIKQCEPCLKELLFFPFSEGRVSIEECTPLFFVPSPLTCGVSKACGACDSLRSEPVQS